MMKILIELLHLRAEDEAGLRIEEEEEASSDNIKTSKAMTKRENSEISTIQEMAGSHGNVHVISSKQEWERKVFEATTNGKTSTGAEGNHGQEMSGTHGSVHMITSKQEWETKLFEATTNGKIVVVDFTASWCGPCKMIAPFYTELSEKYPQLVFLKVDVDELPDVVKEWDIRAMPTFVFIKDGKQIDKLVGLNKPELERKVLNSASMSQSV